MPAKKPPEEDRRQAEGEPSSVFEFKADQYHGPGFVRECALAGVRARMVEILRRAEEVQTRAMEGTTRRKDLHAGAGQKRPRLDKKGQRVWDGGRWREVTSKQCDMLRVLFAAKGEWVWGKDLPARPDKLRKAMHPHVRKLVQTKVHDGYRIPALLPR